MTKKNACVLSRKLTKDLDLLQRHVKMLMLVSKKEPIGIIRLAEYLDIPEHKVRYSLRLLEKDGIVEATKIGAKTTRKTKRYLQELEKDLESMKESIAEIKGILGNSDS